MDLAILNGTIIGNDSISKSNIYIKNGIIAAISEKILIEECKEVIDATDKLIFPGMIDPHVHLNDPGFTWREDFINGSYAAAAGGVTTIIDMPLQNVPALTSQELFKAKQEHIKDRSVVDYAFLGGLIDENLLDLKGLTDAGVVGIKAFIGPVSSDYSHVNMGIVREAMKITAQLNTRLCFHCEDYSIIKMNEKKSFENNKLTRRDFLDSRPVIAELIATRNIIDLAGETGAKVHICHVSHPLVAKEIKQAIRNGIDITAETCAHYLIFDEQYLLDKGSLFKCAPPLRNSKDKEELWNYIMDGTLTCIASDHSPCAPDEKSEEQHGIFGAWGGISGIQNTFQIMFNEVVHKRNLSPTLLAKTLSYGPATAFGLYPRKGLIKIGAHGDMVIVDPNKDWEITSESLFYKNKISAFVGQKGKGVPIITINRGKVVFKDNKIQVEPGTGELIIP